jgi:site-specific recombinase XerD
MPLSPTAIKLLSESDRGKEKLFSLPSDTTVKKHLQRWIAAAGINKHITFYCARHSFAVMMLSKGVNLKVVSDLMGHSDIKQTTVYLQYVDNLKDAAIERMPDLYS